jgi:hypothetical protein
MSCFARAEIGIADLADYQQAVRGHIETISLDTPSSTLYANENGKTNDLAINHRATMLLWAHQRAFRFFDYIAGDALLVGPIDEQGDDTDVPDQFVNMCPKPLASVPKVQTRGDPAWHGDDVRFDRWTDAYSYVLQLAQRWTQIEDVCVVPDA